MESIFLKENFCSQGHKFFPFSVFKTAMRSKNCCTELCAIQVYLFALNWHTFHILSQNSSRLQWLVSSLFMIWLKGLELRSCYFFTFFGTLLRRWTNHLNDAILVWNSACSNNWHSTFIVEATSNWKQLKNT